MKARTNDEKINMTTFLLQNYKNILVYGDGNNGKTYILNKLNDGIIHGIYCDESDNINKYTTPGIGAIIPECNSLKKININDYDAIIEYTGIWDKLSMNYI